MVMKGCDVLSLVLLLWFFDVLDCWKNISFWYIIGRDRFNFCCCICYNKISRKVGNFVFFYFWILFLFILKILGKCMKENRLVFWGCVVWIIFICGLKKKWVCVKKMKNEYVLNCVWFVNERLFEKLFFFCMFFSS